MWSFSHVWPVTVSSLHSSGTRRPGHDKKQTPKKFGDLYQITSLRVPNSMDELVKTFPGLLRVMGDSKEVAEAAAIAAWKHAAGEGLRNHALPLCLEGKTLVVAIADAVWQKQLGAMKGQMLFRINAILGQPLVSQIDLRIDPRMTNIRALPRPEKKEDELDNEVPLELWSAASAIKDKRLRQAFLKAALSSTKRLENR